MSIFVLGPVTFWKNAAAPNELRFHRICLTAAFAVTLIWGAVYIGYGNSGIEDEPGQMGVIEHFALRRPGIPESLPNLPGYHFLVIYLSGDAPTLQSARVVTLGLALAGLGAFAAAWRRRHGTHPGGATLLVALLPIIQPFTAMAYTDVPAMTFIFAAFWAYFSGKQVLAASALTAACLIRQTSIVWAGYLLVLTALDCFYPRNSDSEQRVRVRWGAAFGRWIEEGRWLLLLISVGVGIILYAGRFTLGTAHGNQLEPNLATIHFAGVLLLLFGLPFWAANAGAMLRDFRASMHSRMGRTLSLTALGLGVAAALAATYINRHVWNRELFWPDPASTFVLLRNWPLVWIERIPGLRLVSGLVVIGVTAGLAYLFGRQRCARELWLILPFGAALLLSNGLVEPRYFIPPFALALLFLEPSHSGLVRHIRWFGLLCVVQSAFVLDRLALW
ncbi:MAG: hypothetical protein ABIO94_06135 [Opitutaceae bacterium]